MQYSKTLNDVDITQYLEKPTLFANLNTKYSFSFKDLLFSNWLLYFIPDPPLTIFFSCNSIYKFVFFLKGSPPAPKVRQMPTSTSFSS